ncbi:hypothetical protein SAMN04488134_101234 [Amphibacillus marinus]|uniref:Uncharacterized protein n=1 Tax=Amphibacillus marinus TaxID=872970 RepID=A0A1H8H1L7_9BACI|nr:hypothetical protein [Amphibacillus marinus]SEN50252.1 hypothetical protein SAMN04488134_101234 [Amphibacillus marinus]
MKHDERVISDINIAKRIGFSIFWFGIFAVLIYRWFILNQTLLDTLDVFLVWFIASLVQFFALACKGIPLSYPVTLNNGKQRYFLFFMPLMTGILSAVSVFAKVGFDWTRIIGGFAVSFFGTLIIFLLYRTIVHLWEKRNI